MRGGSAKVIDHQGQESSTPAKKHSSPFPVTGLDSLHVRGLLLAAPDVEAIGADKADLPVVLGETVNGKLHAGSLEGDVLGRLKLKR